MANSKRSSFQRPTKSRMPSSGRIATATIAPIAGDGMSSRRAVPKTAGAAVFRRASHERRQLGAGPRLVHRGGARGRGADRELAARTGGEVAETEGEEVAVRARRVVALLAVGPRHEQALGRRDERERDRRRDERQPHRPVDDRPGQGGRAGRHRPQHRDAGVVEVGDHHDDGGEHQHDQRPRHRAQRSACRAGGSRRRATEISIDHQLTVPSPVDQADDLVDELAAGVDLHPEHLRDLADQDVEREAADEADEDRLREEVREESELEDREQQEHDAAEDRLRQRERQVVGAAGDREPADRRGDQRGGRGIRRRDQLPRRHRPARRRPSARPARTGPRSAGSPAICA